MKGDGDDFGAVRLQRVEPALHAKRVAARASWPVTAEQRAERLARMAALAQAIRADAARLFPDQTPDLQSILPS